jgi:hypothetical protein
VYEDWKQKKESSSHNVDSKRERGGQEGDDSRRMRPHSPAQRTDYNSHDERNAPSE